MDERFRAFYLGFHSVCASNALIMLRPEEVEQLVRIFKFSCSFFFQNNSRENSKDTFFHFEFTGMWMSDFGLD